MRLLNALTLTLEEFEGTKIPKYAILSHTWSSREVTYQETIALNAEVKLKPGFIKVQNFCRLATDLGFTYVWMDTCCIDKRSSAELTEAINSMYRWYQQAELCVVHLEDLDLGQWVQTKGNADEQVNVLKICRWFTRGWTLQELVASHSRRFVTKDWQFIDLDEAEICSPITGIDPQVLSYTRQPAQVCIAERMSWAAERETTRPEDRAYSLMGLFQVSMPILYGEGMQNAFRRLQEEIMKKSFDQTLFAWHAPYDTSGLLARSPSDFRNVLPLTMWGPHGVAPYHMTNAGILVRPFRFNVQSTGTIVEAISIMLQCDVKYNNDWGMLAIRLQRIPNMWCWVNGKKCEAYRRVDCANVKVFYGPVTVRDERFQEIVVLEDEHFELVEQSIANIKQR